MSETSMIKSTGDNIPQGTTSSYLFSTCHGVCINTILYFQVFIFDFPIDI